MSKTADFENFYRSTTLPRSGYLLTPSWLINQAFQVHFQENSKKAKHLTSIAWLYAYSGHTSYAVWEKKKIIHLGPHKISGKH